MENEKAWVIMDPWGILFHDEMPTPGMGRDSDTGSILLFWEKLYFGFRSMYKNTEYVKFTVLVRDMYIIFYLSKHFNS